MRGALQSDWLPFELLASGGQKLAEDETVALNECGLVSGARGLDSRVCHAAAGE